MKLMLSSFQKSLVALAVLCLVTACDNRDTARSHQGGNKSVLTFTADNFSTKVLSSPQPVLVDFWAIWCGPCKMIAPIVSELAAEFEGKVTVGKVDVDAEPGLAKQYGITAIPTLLIFKDGKQVDQIVGLTSKETLKAKLGKLVENSDQGALPPKP